MKFFLEEIYNEALKFASEFTFGFEVEAWIDRYENNDFKSAIEHVMHSFDIVEGVGQFKDDGSIHPGGLEDCYECNGDGRDEDGYECEYCYGRGSYPLDYDGPHWAFEFATPILKFTPFNISKTFELLNTFMDEGAETNETCGFHIHLGFPIENNLKKSIEIFWGLCQLANNKELLGMVKSHKGVKMTDRKYAPFKIFDQLGAILNSNKSNFATLNSLKRLYTSEKYVVFRQHPQGTLEWRGPREFLQNRDFHKSFFINVLYKLVKFFADTLDMKKLKIKNGFISRHDFFAVFEKEDSPSSKVQKKFLDMSNADIADIYKKYGRILSKMQFHSAQIEPSTDESKLTFKEVYITAGVVENCNIVRLRGAQTISFKNVNIKETDVALANNIFQDCSIQELNYSRDNIFKSCVIDESSHIEKNEMFDVIIKNAKSTIRTSKLTKFDIGAEDYYVEFNENNMTDGVIKIGSSSCNFSKNDLKNIKILKIISAKRKTYFEHNTINDCFIINGVIGEGNKIINSTIRDSQIYLNNELINTKFIDCIDEYGDKINV
jgi:hypothetical protein